MSDIILGRRRNAIVSLCSSSEITTFDQSHDISVGLEKVEENLETLEGSVFQDPTISTLAKIQRLKVELRRFRAANLPLQEAVNGLLREEAS